jgi:histidinol-phosphate aminotransferase
MLVAPHALQGAAAQLAPNAPRPVALPVRLDSNENPHGPSPLARKAIMSSFDEACRYPGGRELVNLIADRENVTAEHIVLGCGSTEILCMTGVAYGLGRGEVIAADPTFQGLLRYAETVGAHVIRVPLADGMVHDLDEMERRMTGATRLVFVCNPNNPTATITAPDTLRDFCTSVGRRAVVFVDEAYVDLLANPQEHTMVELVRQGENVIVSRTFSKIHGLAGMRIGYAIARPDIINRLRQYGMGGPNVLGLSAAVASLQDEEFQVFSRARMAEGRAALYELFDEVGYSYTPSFASFVFFRTGIPIRDFQRAMRERGVLVARPFPPYDDWCRVSIGLPAENAVFAAALRSFAGG